MYIYIHIYIHTYIKLNHCTIYLNLTQHCKSTTLLNKNKSLVKEKGDVHNPPGHPRATSPTSSPFFPSMVNLLLKSLSYYLFQFVLFDKYTS